MDASSDLWKAESIFYPPAICEAASACSEAVSDQHKAGVIQSEAAQISVPPGESLEGEEPHDVIEAPGGVNPEMPKEVVELVVGAQIPVAKEPAILAQPLQAIPLAEGPKSTDTDPAQPPPKGTVLQGVETSPVLPSQDVADTELKK